VYEPEGREAMVVTGASSGIGRAVALALTSRGFRVYAGVRRAEDAERLRSAGGAALVPLRLDVTSAKDREDVVERLCGDGVVLKGLVNNAGVVAVGPWEHVDLEAFRHALDVNVVGVAAMVRALLPFLRRAHGRIVSLGSVNGSLALPFLGPYAASKFALEGMTDGLRRELRGSGVSVSLVIPGNVATRVWSRGAVQADEVEASLPREAHAFYGPSLVRMKGYVRAAPHRALPPERVARVVCRALTAQRPRSRYRIGRDARAAAGLARLLPDPVLDGALVRLLRRRRPV